MNAPDDSGWLAVLPGSDLPEGKAVLVTVEGQGVLLYRSGERIYAMADRCTHAAGPLHRGVIGSVSGEPTVTCPLHGSLFRLSDGRVLRGPATRPEPVFEAREHEASIEIRDPS